MLALTTHTTIRTSPSSQSDHAPSVGCVHASYAGVPSTRWEPRCAGTVHLNVDGNAIRFRRTRPTRAADWHHEPSDVTAAWTIRKAGPAERRSHLLNRPRTRPSQRDPMVNAPNGEPRVGLSDVTPWSQRVQRLIDALQGPLATVSRPRACPTRGRSDVSTTNWLTPGALFGHGPGRDGWLRDAPPRQVGSGSRPARVADQLVRVGWPNCEYRRAPSGRRTPRRQV